MIVVLIDFQLKMQNVLTMDIWHTKCGYDFNEISQNAITKNKQIKLK